MGGVEFDRNELGSVSLHQRTKATFAILPVVILYIPAIAYCFQTSGIPYQLALAKAMIEVHPDGEDVPLLPCQPLPGELMPTFVARILLACVVIAHVLFLLAQRWSVWFYCAVNTKNATFANADCVQVTPLQHRGKAALVDLHRIKGSISRYFIFQKQRFIYEEDETDLTSTKMFRLVACPVDLSLGTYEKHKGNDSEDIPSLLERHGPNKFEIQLPSFQELYLEGLLAPFSVFQMFCILLWSLDDYWQFSVFTLFMMLVFEGTVVMSRRKNIQTLSGMNNDARNIYVFRDNTWTRVSNEQLIPGDVISISGGGGSKDAEGVLPCDCLLLRGSAVVNEATLTGESIPQLKENIIVDDVTKSTPLDMKNAHKVHILFGGTRVLQQSGAMVGHGKSTHAIPPAPDNGAVCYVLRTGFSSSQGQLVRMIEFSSQNVSGNTKEALLLVAFLLIFAILASGYVLQRGLEEERDQFDLLLHCILVITSVIPPELHMQLALAVNASLIALMKLHVFCTEPFRIPLAGKVSSCLFDKTGTITTDELVAAGTVLPPHQTNPGGGKAHGAAVTIPMIQSSLECSIVMAGCHSLVVVDGKLAGDPLETAAIKAVQWKFDPVSNTCSPIPEVAARTWKDKPSVRIVHRHHFASALQRMSTIAEVKLSGHAKPALWALVKGSPEVVKTLLQSPSDTFSAWYDRSYTDLANDGMRVIALAYRPLPDSSEAELLEQPRSSIEKDLIFAGFIAFRCLIRRDSADIIKGLQESSHDVLMLTGDSLRTALYVANEVHINRFPRSQTLILEVINNTELVWRNAVTEVSQPLDLNTIKTINRTHDLSTTGDSLHVALELCPGLADYLQYFRVFARMSPDRKESVIMALNARHHFTLMCGDGANDVGALKQAHVGIALLSGFGSANAAKPKEKDAKTAIEAKPVSNPLLPPMTMEERKRKAKEDQEKMRIELMQETEALQARGEWFAPVKAMKIVMARQAERQKAQRDQLIGQIGTDNPFAASAAMMSASDMDDGSVPMVKLGDASIASPFTSKKPSIQATIDVIRQGRCTLVTTLQMYQILALNCLINSYSLSVLYLDGVKYGDRQKTCMGILMSISFVSISNAKSLDKLSPVRPILTIFHPAMFLSLVGQFAIHLATMIYTVSITKPYLPATYAPNIEGTFEPNLINSAVFLVTCVQQVSVFAVNYKGHPFMHGLTSNKGLMYSLSICGIGGFLAATNAIPTFNKWLQLVEYPSEDYAQIILFVLLFDVIGAFVWDRLMLAIFAPEVFRASIQAITVQEVVRVLRILGFITAILYFFIGSTDFEALENMEFEEEL